MVRLKCPRDSLPIIEMALEERGFTITHPNNGNTITLVLCRGCGVAVLIATHRGDDAALIDVYGSGQASIVHLLQDLPIELQREY